VIIRRRVLDEILQHARDAQPNECCGILLGAGDRIDESWRAVNLAASPNRYEIDPRDHFAARRSARARGLAVVGFYHSHPHSAPIPSSTDRAEALYDDVVHLIVGWSGDAWAARAFVIGKSDAVEVKLRVSDEALAPGDGEN
jgi:proteasome lid subunit RPN8/RPN11